MITSRGQESVIVQCLDHRKTANWGVMTSQCGHFLPIYQVNVNCLIFWSCGNVLVIYEENTQNRISVISDYSLSVIKIHCFSVLNDWTLLVGRDKLELGFEVLLTHGRGIFGLALKLKVDIFLIEAFINDRDIGIVVRVMGVEYILLVEVHVIHFLKNHVGVFLLLPFPLNDGLRGSDVVMEPAIDVSQEVPKTASKLFKLIVHFFVFVERTVCAAD